jgi:hypothetical protein
MQQQFNSSSSAYVVDGFPGAPEKEIYCENSNGTTWLVQHSGFWWYYMARPVREKSPSPALAGNLAIGISFTHLRMQMYKYFVNLVKVRKSIEI